MSRKSRRKARARREQRIDSGVNRICYLFGHKHSNIDLLMARIKGLFNSSQKASKTYKKRVKC